MPKLCRAPRLLLLLGLSACAPSLPSSQIERDWSDTMQRYNLIGLYPITEDLQPGDILLDVPPAADADPQPRMQRLGTLRRDVLVAALQGQEAGRLRFERSKPAAAAPAAPAAPPGATVTTTADAPAGSTVDTRTTVHPAPPAGPAPQPRPARPAADKTRAPAPPAPKTPEPDIVEADTASPGDHQVRFRRNALPALTAARIYDWQIGGAGPIGRVAIALGLAGNGSAAVLVHLDDLQLLGFDSVTALDLFDGNKLGWLADRRLTPLKLLRLVNQSNPAVASRICRGVQPDRADNRALIRIVNRVMYAHGIEYEYAHSSEFAGRLAVQASLGAAADRVPALAAGTAPAPGAASGPGLTAEQARLQAIEAALAAATPTLGGGSGRLGIGTYGNASLSKTFEEPMAVGFGVVSDIPVRDALILLSPAAASATGGAPVPERRVQLDQVRKFCDRFLGDERAKAADGTPWSDRKSPIETIVCTRTGHYDLPTAEACNDRRPWFPVQLDPGIAATQARDRLSHTIQ